MNKPHKHAALIKQWADGAVIQYKTGDSSPWEDSPDNWPSWSKEIQYRVKPVTRKYRVAAFKDCSIIASSDNQANAFEIAYGFSRWLTDWIEYEV